MLTGARKQGALLVLAVALAVALVWVLVVWEPAAEPPASHAQLDVAGVPAGGDFTLRTADGPLALQALRGQVVLIYFGYTYCPDVCPTSLAFMSQGLSLLAPEESAQVTGVFISVDPARDTPERLATYAGYFHPRILGASDTPEVIDEVARRYGAAYQIHEGDSATGYLVDHTSYTYVVAPDGRLREVLAHGTPPDAVAAAVRAALAGGDA
ncbi:SCO family protein [Ectothiorhodospiraceae bacterium 2226]|nr:SCO family protein [Ectothiorhodospiraceae bacterium 2226]